ncbi:hypothetical protein Spb1_16730 [Planctopirus ephydatiae]|uniref:Uncharacterized protein n=1 Tax=Planctopirus ephydatiae TaxID=2528019 RepID=A0A518GMH2_9PLAN|nr:hypothetical protein Spb1_16730 [Planctopirus ephydatiae]
MVVLVAEILLVFSHEQVRDMLIDHAIHRNIDLVTTHQPGFLIEAGLLCWQFIVLQFFRGDGVPPLHEKQSGDSDCATAGI